MDFSECALIRIDAIYVWSMVLLNIRIALNEKGAIGTSHLPLFSLNQSCFRNSLP